MILANAVTPASHTGWTLLLLSGLLGLSGLGTVWLFRNPDTCAVASCKPDWRAAASYLRRDIGTSGNRAATVGLLADRSLPYYDDGFADHVRLQRLRERLPRMGRLASQIFGADAAILDAFKKEREEVDSQLERDSREKIAVLSLPEVRRAGPGQLRCPLRHGESAHAPKWTTAPAVADTTRLSAHRGAVVSSAPHL